MKTRIIVLALLMGCGDSDDGGTNKTFSACDVRPAPASYAYPSGPYGIDVGDRFEDITLNDCDRNPVQFADVLSGSKLVLFNIGAGWCQPCIEETRDLEEGVYRPYCEEGFHVVQVLFEDANASPATSLFCRQWKQQFGLTFTVLIDPAFDTQKYFQDVGAQTPINLLIDSQGRVRHREVGSPGETLGSAIANLMAE